MIRRQLSLYVAEPEASMLEALRLVLDPVQQALIPAHATLAREGEFGQRSDLEWRERVAGLREPCLRMGFGRFTPTGAASGIEATATLYDISLP